MSLCRILIDGFSLFLIIWLSFVCCCRGYGPCCGATVYLWVCVCVSAGACACAFMRTRTCFMVNKQLFSAKVFQLLIRSLVVMQCCGSLEDESQQIGQLCRFGPRLTFRNVSKCTMFIASDNTHSFREWANIKWSVQDKPKWVFSVTLCFIAYWRICSICS